MMRVCTLTIAAGLALILCVGAVSAQTPETVSNYAQQGVGDLPREPQYATAYWAAKIATELGGVKTTPAELWSKYQAPIVAANRSKFSGCPSLGFVPGLGANTYWLASMLNRPDKPFGKIGFQWYSSGITSDIADEAVKRGCVVLMDIASIPRSQGTTIVLTPDGKIEGSALGHQVMRYLGQDEGFEEPLYCVEFFAPVQADIVAFRQGDTIARIWTGHIFQTGNHSLAGPLVGILTRVYNGVSGRGVIVWKEPTQTSSAPPVG